MSASSGSVGALAAAIDTLVALDPAVLGDGDTLLELNRQLERLSAVATRATATFDTSKEWEAAGARSAAAWLTAFAHLPKATAQRRVRTGRALRQMERVEEAWLGGEVGEAQVGRLARARTPVSEEAFARDEKLLVDDAVRLRFAELSRVVDYWSYHADPDGSESDAAHQEAARRLHLSQSFGGTFLGDFALDPIRGVIVAGELKRREKELFEADWAEARQRLGRDPHADELRRTPAQRRADALVTVSS